jgi:hypothetical protein
LRYVNSVASEIDGSDLICAPDMFSFISLIWLLDNVLNNNFDAFSKLNDQ